MWETTSVRVVLLKIIFFTFFALQQFMNCPKKIHNSYHNFLQDFLLLNNIFKVNINKYEKIKLQTKKNIIADKQSAKEKKSPRKTKENLARKSPTSRPLLCRLSICLCD